MRGHDEQTTHMFSYLSPEQRVPADHPLRAVRALTDEALQTMSRRFASLYATTGRPSIPPEQLLRALLLQVLYTVREGGTGRWHRWRERRPTHRGWVPSPRHDNG